jgi:hypothetical protein
VARLLINEGGQATVFELLDDDVTLGRGASNSVQVTDDHASKHHAVIRRVSSRLKLIDLESKNGTKVNGEFRNQRWLEHGDAISIGAAVFTFDAAEAAGAKGAARGVATRAAPGVAAPTVAGAVPRAAPAPRRSARTGARRERSRDEEEDGEEPQERVPKRTSNSAAIAIMATVGGLILFGLFFLILSKAGGGRSGNAFVLAEAKRMHAAGQTQRAYDYLKANSDPSDVDGYVSVKEELQRWQKVLETEHVLVDEGEATKVFNKIEHDRIEMHKNGLTEQALGERLREFAQKYKGTNAELALRRNNYPPNLKLWRLLVMAEGKNPNAEAIAVARKIWTDEKDRAGAMAFLEAHADPTDAEGHKAVQDQLSTWEKIR